MTRPATWESSKCKKFQHAACTSAECNCLCHRPKANPLKEPLEGAVTSGQRTRPVYEVVEEDLETLRKDEEE